MSALVIVYQLQRPSHLPLFANSTVPTIFSRCSRASFYDDALPYPQKSV